MNQPFAFEPAHTVKVAVSGGHFATLDEDALPLLGDLLNRSWCLNSNGRGRRYVSTHRGPTDARQSVVAIARIVAGAAPGERVTYLNGDTTDLRRANLQLGRDRVRAGKAKAQPPMEAQQ